MAQKTVETHPHWWALAAHELGHAAAARAHGIRVYHVTLDSGGGNCRHGDGSTDDPDYLAALLVILLAGEASQKLWVTRRLGGTVPRRARGSDYLDMREFRQLRKLQKLSDGKIRSAADSIVRANFAWIDGQTADLVRRGKLSGSSL